MSLTIEQLLLNPVAKKVATDLLAAHPTVIFTSGRRNIWQQAHAMATNVLQERDWIRKTYIHAATLQSWVDQHPEVNDLDPMTQGLYQVLIGMAPIERDMISRHLSGDAFDLQPMVDEEELCTEAGVAVQQWIEHRRNVEKDVEKFLNHEGGLCRWHLQCASSIET